MYIDSRNKLFGHLDRLADWQRGKHAAPVTVEWDLSNRCALGCVDCHFAHTHTRGPWATKSRVLPMAFDAGGDLADPALVHYGLRQMVDAGVRGVVFSGGGEPTTHPEWLDILTYTVSIGMRVGMYTLGGLLDRDNARALATLASWVVVSLDCIDAADYAAEKGVTEARFFAARDAIIAMTDVKAAVIGVSFLLHEQNWRKAGDMLLYARQLGATYATFRPAIRTSPAAPSVCTDDRSWVTEAIPLLTQLALEPDAEIDVERFTDYRDWSVRPYSACHGVKLTSVVTPDGRMWMCPQHRGVNGSCLGDLRIESFKEIWQRHTGEYRDFDNCRVMCRLHLMNQTLAPIFEKRPHEAFL